VPSQVASPNSTWRGPRHDRTHDASTHAPYLGTRSPLPVPESKQQRVGCVMWNGTLREQLDLMAAQHNCECILDDTTRPLSTCSGHAMLTQDQRALDGLLWNRHLIERLRTEEGSAEREPRRSSSGHGRDK
jgi:hypothetical protein